MLFFFLPQGRQSVFSLAGMMEMCVYLISVIKSLAVAYPRKDAFFEYAVARKQRIYGTAFGFTRFYKQSIRSCHILQNIITHDFVSKISKISHAEMQDRCTGTWGKGSLLSEDGHDISPHYAKIKSWEDLFFVLRMPRTNFEHTVTLIIDIRYSGIFYINPIYHHLSSVIQ